MEFCVENIVARTRKLRDEFGSSKALSEASGCSLAMVSNYCSPAYLKKHKADRKIWEKHFGLWDQPAVEDVKPVEPIDDAKDITEVQVDEPKAVEQIEAPAKKKAKIIIEVPSLGELEETLASFGFRLEFIPR